MVAGPAATVAWANAGLQPDVSLGDAGSGRDAAIPAGGLDDGLTLNLEGAHRQQGGPTPADTGLLLQVEWPW